MHSGILIRKPRNSARDGKGPVAAAFSLCLMLMCGVAVSQDTTKPGLTTRDMLNETSDALDRETSLSQEQSEELDSKLKAVGRNIDKANEFGQRSLEIRQTTEAAPDRIADYKQQLDEAEEHEYQLPDILPGEATLDAIDSQRALMETELRTMSARRDKLRQETAARDERRAAIQTRLVEVQTKLGEVIGAPFPQEGDVQEKTAALFILSGKDAWRAERESLKAELIAEPVLANLRAAELDWLTLSVEQTEQKLNVLADAAQIATTRKTEQKLQSIDALEAQMQGDNDALMRFVDENRVLAARQQQTAESVELARAEAAALRAQLEKLRQDAVLMRQRLEVAGREEDLGRVMSVLLDNMPNTRLLQQQMKVRASAISSLSLEIIDIEEKRSQLGINAKNSQAYQELTRELDEQQQGFFDQLLEQRTQLLEDAKDARAGLRQLLTDNNADSSHIIVEAHSFQQFLLGNLLWVRSYDRLSLEMLREQLAALFSWHDWRDLPLRAAKGLRTSSWTMSWLLALIMVSLLAAHSRAKYEDLVSRPVPLYSMRASHIILAAAWAMLLVLPWALVVQLLSKSLVSTASESQFQTAVSPAISFLAPVVYTLLFMRLLLDGRGIGRRLLKWNAAVLARLRNEVRWLGPLLGFSGFITVFAMNLDVAAGAGALGALGIFVSAAAVVIAAVRLLRSRLFDDNQLVKVILQLVCVLGLTVILLQAQGFFFAADIFLLSLGKSFFAIIN